MIYVLSDIHGNLKNFNSIMDQINLQETDTLYVLGDVIDIKQKAGYVAHLGRMFGKGKKNKDEEE